MLPTVAEVLALDVMRRGEPRVVAGTDRLGTLVRWVHAIELADAARLLRGGELVLATGIALPDEGPLLDAYVAGLASVGLAGLAVELGRRYTGGLPAGFVAAAESHRLPLIVFGREVPFVEITEAVHARIIDDQLDQLRASARLHEVFTDLAVAGAGPAEILRQAALLAGRPVILEDLSHHVLACEPAGADPAALLDGFEARSRAVGPGRADQLRRAVRLAGHHGRRAGRGLGPGHPGLRCAAGSRRPGAGGAHRDHARAGPAAHPPAREPGTAGARDADRRHRGRRLPRPGRGGGAGPGPGRPGDRAATAGHGGHVSATGGGGCRPTPWRPRSPTLWPTRAAASESPRWSARSARKVSAPCCPWTGAHRATRRSARSARLPGGGCPVTTW